VLVEIGNLMQAASIDTVNRDQFFERSISLSECVFESAQNKMTAQYKLYEIANACQARLYLHKVSGLVPGKMTPQLFQVDTGYIVI
jgi:hypothetical protein